MKRLGRIWWSGNNMMTHGSPLRGSVTRRKSLPSLAVLPFLCAAALVASAPAAHADLRLCNKTSGNIGVAIGYKTADAWTTEGWWNVDANGCQVVVDGPLSSRYFYIYAIDYDNGGEWGGQAFMCTREKEFTINGIEDCLARGFERTGFFEVDTGEQRNWTVQLTERPSAGVGGQ